MTLQELADALIGRVIHVNVTNIDRKTGLITVKEEA
jgi:hypothetical protein